MTEIENGDTTEKILEQGGQREEKTEPLNLSVSDLEVLPPGQIKVDEKGTLIIPAIGYETNP